MQLWWRRGNTMHLVDVLVSLNSYVLCGLYKGIRHPSPSPSTCHSLLTKSFETRRNTLQMTPLFPHFSYYLHPLPTKYEYPTLPCYLLVMLHNSSWWMSCDITPSFKISTGIRLLATQIKLQFRLVVYKLISERSFFEFMVFGKFLRNELTKNIFLFNGKCVIFGGKWIFPFFLVVVHCGLPTEVFFFFFLILFKLL